MKLGHFGKLQFLRHFLIALAAGLFFCLAHPAPTAAQDLGKGLTTGKKAGDLKEPRKSGRATKTRQGPAQRYLGLLSQYAQRLAQDSALAASWLNSSANQGLAMAQTYVGHLYDTGRGVRQNYGQAISWFRMAADQGLAIAQYNLGVKYSKGHGVKRDYAQAAYWLHKSAGQGLALAQNKLGIQYQRGLGVPQDDAEAAAWYQKAADQGLALAQFSLATLYHHGQGITQDDKQAHMWLDLAGRTIEDARVARDQLAILMTLEQVLDARRMSRNWKRKQLGK